MNKIPHFAIVQDGLGKAVQFPLKRWVKQNIDNLPSGFSYDLTSHQMRGRLVQIGWRLNLTGNAVYVVRPDSNNQFQYAEAYLNEIIEDEEEEIEGAEEASEITFGLERDLQIALRQNIDSLESGLQITDNGKERNTIAGRIDITAKDTNGKTVIIELKAVEAKPDVLAQVLAYMEAVCKEDNTEVRGIIVASGFSERVKLATRQVTQVKLVTYSFKFNFNTID